MHITNWKNQSEKDSYCKIPVIWCSGEIKTMEITKKRSVVVDGGGINRQSTAVFLEQWTIPYDSAVVDTIVKTQDVQCQDWILM